MLKGAYKDVVLHHGVGKPLKVRENVLLEELHAVFAAAFQAQPVLRERCSAFLSAVYKHWDPANLNNYRGIAMGSEMGKPYCMVL